MDTLLDNIGGIPVVEAQQRGGLGQAALQLQPLFLDGRFFCLLAFVGGGGVRVVGKGDGRSRNFLQHISYS